MWKMQSCKVKNDPHHLLPTGWVDIQSCNVLKCSSPPFARQAPQDGRLNRTERPLCRITSVSGSENICSFLQSSQGAGHHICDLRVADTDPRIVSEGDHVLIVSVESLVLNVISWCLYEKLLSQDDKIYCKTKCIFFGCSRFFD